MKKTCTSCNRRLSSDAFAARTAAPDGLQVWCRRCMSYYHRALYAKRQGDLRMARRLRLEQQHASA